MSEQIMLINNIPGEECRIAIVENGKLEELYTERTSEATHVNNIYRGKVTNVEPSIQAAFIDFGIDRNGFLHISDLHPMFFPGDEKQDVERVGQKTARKHRPPIQNCLKRGDEILVQVLKEGIGTKGPTLTSYLSIPGRFLVMMPKMERSGVSRKAEDETTRKKMKEVLSSLDIPEDFGVIMRTAGIDRSKLEIKRDFAYLTRLWQNIEVQQGIGHGPKELYTESDLVVRTLRDILSPDIKKIIIDDPAAAVRAKKFLQIAAPRGGRKVYFYDKQEPIFDAYGIEEQVQGVYAHEAPMKSGGYLVIDSAEALVAIDVNSGKNRENSDAEETAYQTNLEAADEVCRQLRLRDLGGLVVVDFIDMYMAKHRRAIEKRMKDNLKNDRARSKVLRISELGLMQMTRQRMRAAEMMDDAHAKALTVIRKISRLLAIEMIHHIKVEVHPDVITVLLNRMRRLITRYENKFEKTIEFGADSTLELNDIKFYGFDRRGVRQDVDHLPTLKAPALTAIKEIKAKDEVPIEDLLDEVEDALIEASGMELVDATEPEPELAETKNEKQEEGKKDGKRQRRRRKRKRKNDNSDNASAEDTQAAEKSENSEAKANKTDAEGDAEGNKEGEGKGRKKKSTRKRSRKKSTAKKNDSEGDKENTSEAKPKSSKKKTSSRNTRTAKPTAEKEANKTDGGKEDESKPKRRTFPTRIKRKLVHGASASEGSSSGYGNRLKGIQTKPAGEDAS